MCAAMPKPSNGARPAGGRRWLGRLSVLTCGLLPLLALAAALHPEPGTQTPVAAVFPLTYSVEDTLHALSFTGARLVAPGGIGAVFIVQSNDPDLSDRLYKAGAWFLLNSRAAAWCQAAPG